MDGLLRIGEIASRAGVSTRTVDFYTGLGLLAPAARTGGNFRLYEPAAVDRIAAIRRMEADGVSLDDIVQALAAPHLRDDVAMLLSLLQDDLRALQAVTDTVEPDAHGLLAAITVRARSLIHTALDLAAHDPFETPRP